MGNETSGCPDPTFGMRAGLGHDQRIVRLCSLRRLGTGLRRGRRLRDLGVWGCRGLGFGGLGVEGVGFRVSGLGFRDLGI